MFHKYDFIFLKDLKIENHLNIEIVLSSCKIDALLNYRDFRPPHAICKRSLKSLFKVSNESFIVMLERLIPA